MPVWKAKTIDVEPAITLQRWIIVEITGTETTGPEATGATTPASSYAGRHIVGQRCDDLTGRTSSQIISRDGLTFTTASGRRYTLVGPPGVEDQGAYTLSVWLLGSTATLDDLEITDVSHEYWDAPDQTPLVVQTAHTAYQVDVARRRVRRIFSGHEPTIHQQTVENGEWQPYWGCGPSPEFPRALMFIWRVDPGVVRRTVTSDIEPIRN